MPVGYHAKISLLRRETTLTVSEVTDQYNEMTAQGTPRYATFWREHVLILLQEIDRLKGRLNHQTEDDRELCRQGKHRDCGYRDSAGNLLTRE